MLDANIKFMVRGRRFYNSKSIFDKESVEYPYNILQDRIESFERLWRTYDGVLKNSEEDIKSLKASLDLLENSILANLRNNMLNAKAYLAGNTS